MEWKILVSELEQEEQALREALERVRRSEDLQTLKARFVGKKSLLQERLRALREIPPEDRPRAGKLLNEKKRLWLSWIQEKQKALETSRRHELDPTLPGRRLPRGGFHPLHRVAREILDIFVRMGFERVEGPLVEYDWYNFEALNIPPHHPARDMQSSFFIEDKILLRTHTSSVQIRVMEQRKPPLRVVSPGRVFRVDEFDASHAPGFFQMEGLYVDRHVTFSNLKGTLISFLRAFFGPDIEVRFLPSYFPFTEPSAEVAVRFRGEWLEVLGCGMVHPSVLRAVGIDPEEWRGYAFGLGLDRFAMIRYGVDDIRRFYQSDLRFLEQFA